MKKLKNSKIYFNFKTQLLTELSIIKKFLIFILKLKKHIYIYYKEIEKFENLF